jgi:hypothetical protein
MATRGRANSVVKWPRCFRPARRPGGAGADDRRLPERVRMNAARKVVFSRTLRAAEWAKPPSPLVTRQKRLTSSGELATATSWSGAALAFSRSLMRLDLIDEFRLDFYPTLRARVPGCSMTSAGPTGSTWFPAPRQQRDCRAAVPPAPPNRRSTRTTSGNQASATTWPRGPWPTQTNERYLRHRRDRQRRVDPKINLKAHTSAGDCPADRCGVRRIREPAVVRPRVGRPSRRVRLGCRRSYCHASRHRA